MCKILSVITALVFGIALSGCVSNSAGTYDFATCEEAVMLYNGRISEDEWLKKTGAENRGQPAKDFSAVKLADGFLFYAVENENGVKMICDIVVPANGDKQLKEFAKSLRRNVPEDMDFIIGEKTISCAGKVFSDAEFLVFLKKNSEAPYSKQHAVYVTLDNTLSGNRVLQIQELLKSLGLDNSVEIRTSQKPVEVVK